MKAPSRSPLTAQAQVGVQKGHPEGGLLRSPFGSHRNAGIGSWEPQKAVSCVARQQGGRCGLGAPRQFSFNYTELIPSTLPPVCCLGLPSFSCRGNGRLFREPAVSVSRWKVMVESRKQSDIRTIARRFMVHSRCPALFGTASHPCPYSEFFKIYIAHREPLPHCRGTLVAVQPGAAFCAPPVLYIADHDTTPQQVVKNDTTSHLVRTLQNKKMKEEAKRKQSRTAGGSNAGVHASHQGWHEFVTPSLRQAGLPLATGMRAPGPAQASQVARHRKSSAILSAALVSTATSPAAVSCCLCRQGKAASRGG